MCGADPFLVCGPAAVRRQSNMSISHFDAKTGRVVGLLFIVVGSLMALAGALWLIHTAWFVVHAAKAPGTVIAMDESDDSDHGTIYYPRFTFSDASGIIHTQRSSFGSSNFSFEVGEKVTILYEAATPKHSSIDSFQTVWLGPLFVAVFGLLFGGFACVWSYLWKRGVQKQRIEDVA